MVARILRTRQYFILALVVGVIALMLIVASIAASPDDGSMLAGSLISATTLAISWRLGRRRTVIDGGDLYIHNLIRRYHFPISDIQAFHLHRRPLGVFKAYVQVRDGTTLIPAGGLSVAIDKPEAAAVLADQLRGIAPVCTEGRSD